MKKIIAGLDIGNGYVKGLINEVNGKVTTVDFPSAVAYMTNPHNIKTEIEDAKAIIDDIYNEMDVSFVSPLVKHPIRRLFGVRGVKSGMPIDEFDVHSKLSKTKQELSAILVLGIYAGKALQLYFEEKGELPKSELNVKCYASLALPISEYKRYKDKYANMFKNDKHIVHFFNFEDVITVNITFEDVLVSPEGASANVAIFESGEAFMQAMLDDVRTLDKDALKGITSKDLLEAKNTISIDIGEGTVNFPVFDNGRFVPEASITYSEGYGTVLSNVLSRIGELGYTFPTRKALSEFMETRPRALNKERYNAIKKVLDEEIISFCNAISMQFIKVMGKAGAYAEVAYVYGGGASWIKDLLHTKLLDTAKSLGEGSQIPILYLDSRYSRFLNRKGLHIMATKAFANIDNDSTEA